ncbi:NAD(P)/FAD-dependent oxidoreductase [candidate division CSSED10-310 bacterium]|uniref:NAD(P)/FAD-dependent oxidoreductase n=1 Tax=candidate division CSSED10-310 bacterium TaxID=2855610 RepID=A0ABV6Z605_UNCC1
MCKSRWRVSPHFLEGGPAGLAAAIELEPHGYDVLLIEKESIGKPQKSWISYRYNTELHGLNESILLSYDQVANYSYLGQDVFFRGHFDSLNESKVVQNLRQKLQYCTVLEECELSDFRLILPLFLCLIPASGYRTRNLMISSRRLSKWTLPRSAVVSFYQ